MTSKSVNVIVENREEVVVIENGVYRFERFAVTFGGIADGSITL